MIDIEIESTGRRLVLKREERIRVTYQAADFADAGAGKGSFSTSFTAPMTADNIETLGFSPVLNVRASLSPYKNIKARLLDGSNEIDKGFIRIDEDDPVSREITFTFLGRNVDWFSSLSDRTLLDLDFSRYDHIVTADIATENRTEGYIYLPVDYGLLDNKSSASIDVTEIYPALFVKDIVKQIFKDIGYKVRGTVLSRPDYNRMLIPFNGITPVHSDEWINNRTVYVTGTGNQTNLTPTDHLFQLNNVSSDTFVVVSGKFLYMKNSPLGNFNTTSYRYTADEPMLIKVSGIINLTQTGNYVVKIKRNGIDMQTYNFNFRATAFTSNEIYLDTGDYIELTMGAAQSIQYTNAVNKQTSTSFYFVPQKTIALNSQYQISQFLTDMKQADLMEYLFFIFCIIPSFDKATNSVVLDCVNDLTINSAEDWTGKVDTKQNLNRDYFGFISSYTRNNICKYENDQDDFLLQQYINSFAQEYGQGSILIDNDYLEGSSEYYTAPFAPTISRKVFQGVANLNMFLPYVPQADNPIPRIFLYAPNVSIEELSSGVITTMTIAGKTVTHIPYAYFILPSAQPLDDPISTQHLGFGNTLDLESYGKSILDVNYNKLTRVLNVPLIARPFLKMSALEIATIKYNRLKYIEELGGYYYLNKVGQYDGSGDPVECELIKWY